MMGTARKSKGSGKVELRNGKYRTRLRIKRADGTWGSRSFTADTAKEANRLRDEYERLLEQGFDPNGGDLTIAEYLPMWLERHRTRHKRRTGRDLATGTIHNYERSSNQLIEAIGKSKLKNCSARVLEDAIFHGDATPHTAQKRHLVLSAAFKAALVDGMMDFDPMIRVDHPFVPEAKEGVYFEPHEIEQIFEAAYATRFEFSLQIHLALGCRISELLALRESDVDYLNNTVTINKSTDFSRGSYGTIKPTKNYETRIIKVSDSALDLFRKQKELRKFAYHMDYKPALWQQDEDELIFPNAISGLWNPRVYAFDLHAEVYSRTNITRPDRKTLGTHAWRHTCGAILISAGVPLKVVSEFLGHKSLSVTERIYSHLLVAPRQEVASILAKALVG